jgi:hypothetical protein
MLSTKTSKGYLAQHRLFDQISQLRRDIIVPDYCALFGPEDENGNDVEVDAAVEVGAQVHSGQSASSSSGCKGGVVNTKVKEKDEVDNDKMSTNPNSTLLSDRDVRPPSYSQTLASENPVIGQSSAHIPTTESLSNST